MQTKHKLSFLLLKQKTTISLLSFTFLNVDFYVVYFLKYNYNLHHYSWIDIHIKVNVHEHTHTCTKFVCTDECRRHVCIYV